MSDDKFRMNTTIFCLVFFIVMSSGHALGLYVKGSLEAGEIERQLSDDTISNSMRAQLEGNLSNISKMDFWTILSGIGNVLFGMDLPLPFTILVSMVNLILLVAIIFVNWSILKAHIPFISG
jgi:hypothetical protein